MRIKLKKPGEDIICPPTAFGFPDFIQLSANQTFTSGRRPKIKAAPKVKGKKSEIAVSNHDGLYWLMPACRVKKKMNICRIPLNLTVVKPFGLR
jgi:hypothetical protein